MTSRDRVINTLCHQYSTPVPMMMTIPAGIEKSHGNVCAQLRSRFPNDIDFLDFSASAACGLPESAASVMDSWNCVWEENADGVWNYSEVPPYEDMLELEGIRFPKNPVTPEILNRVNAVCAESSHFVAVQTAIHPFMRLCALGGLEATQELFRRKPRELKEIMSRFRDYYLKQLDVWCSTDVDAVGFGDNFADAHGLFISVPRLNEFFFPLYQEICQKIRSCDKFVYFTGSGNFEEFLSGLIYAGVDVVRFDAEAMDSAALLEHYAQRVAFQPVVKPEMMENSTEDEIAQKILSIRTVFENNTGLIAECQIPGSVPVRKVAGSMLNWRRRMPKPEEF